MRVLVLTSRYTATRDIIGEDFGRQTRLFSALRKLGHNIDFLVADYRKFESKETKLNGISISIRPFGIFHFLSFLKSLDNKIKSKKYDFLIASSDPLWGIIGYIYAKKNKTRFVYDLHDNYEIYATYKLPFLRFLDKYTIRHSDAITAVSNSLKDKLSKIRKGDVFVVQNGVDAILFKPMEKSKCREKLGLPKNAKIIAYAGSIQRAQGLQVLIEAFEKLKDKIPNVILVLAGRFYKNEGKYFDLKRNGVKYLGSLDQNKVACLINAADVAIIPNTKNEFTKYCFPYKVLEYMACQKPIVATNVGDVGKLLSKYDGSLCNPSNADEMAGKIEKQLKKSKVDYTKDVKEYSWTNIARKMDNILRRL